ncbi:hypothetical protein F5884DRAFT_885869 [Xylogone sp. PMI_703]|nr:hypothetical protein F5884DRAFT_885869 [Xylogone sp. PMI_703]
MFDTQIVSFEYTRNGVDLLSAHVMVDEYDFEGIHIAAENLTTDLQRVSGRKVHSRNKSDSTNGRLDSVILVGSLQKSRYIQELATDGILDTTKIKGKWESFMTQVLEVPWANRCLVVAGSDKRGAIYGIYTLCEQIGVSPWHWWADVPVKNRDHIYALPTTTYQGEPSVKYRGFFINDETPSLSSWVHEKIGPKFNYDFYKTVFELLLRLKANFLWPAMWSGHPFPGRSFFADDPRNQEMADKYGIVVSTSHHEPMQRSTTEWRVNGEGGWVWGENKEKIINFFEKGVKRAKPFESILTLGMRGEGDQSIQADDAKETLKDVLATQRSIIRNFHGEETGEKQLIVLYKEVLEYYENGLSIPDDVTLMFTDDNFGNIRRVPTSSERKRPGGSGLYYHFEYVGHPRGYKWINTNTLGKTYQQLRTAYDCGANTIWVINVGDIKPLELPFTFAMQLAWNIDQISPSNIPEFLQQWSTREFGSEQADQVSGLLLRHDRLLALRKHEHIEANTFPIVNYREADIILSSYKYLERQAISISRTIPDICKACFFQLVLHPIKASRIYVELRISQAKNQLYGQQRRNSTNAYARRVLDLFDEDFSLSKEFHNNPWTGDKWNHIMRQPHYGYSNETWHDPSRDLITGLCYVHLQQDSNSIVGQIGVVVEGHPGVRPGLMNETDRMQPSRNDLVAGLTVPVMTPYGPPSRWFEIFSRGSKTVQWAATVDEKWVLLSTVSGEVSPFRGIDDRVEISIDWGCVPVGFNDEILVHITSTTGDYEQVHVPVANYSVPSDFHGWVESDGCISIEAGALLLTPNQIAFYEHHQYLGRTSAGAICLRSESTSPSEVPFLEYSIFVHSDRPHTIQPNARLEYDISFDDEIQASVPLINRPGPPGELPLGWSTAVMDGVWRKSHSFSNVAPGRHQLRFRPLARGLVIEKFVVDLGGVRESYLGPPSSTQV